MLLTKNSLQKVALIMLRMIRNLVALMLVMDVYGTFKVDLNNTLSGGGKGRRGEARKETAGVKTFGMCSLWVQLPPSRADVGSCRVQIPARSIADTRGKNDTRNCMDTVMHYLFYCRSANLEMYTL